MPLTYAESAELMGNPQFRERVKVACLHYATYISDEPVDTPAHNTRNKWAQNTFVAPDSSAALVTPATVMDDKVQEQGGDLPDNELQVAVETAINKLM